jgi:hypothetical protein
LATINDRKNKTNFLVNGYKVADANFKQYPAIEGKMQPAVTIFFM